MNPKEYVDSVIKGLSKYFDMKPFIEDEFYTKVTDDECVYVSRLNGDAVMELNVYRAKNGWKMVVDVYSLNQTRDAYVVSSGFMPPDSVFSFVDGAYRAFEA